MKKSVMTVTAIVCLLLLVLAGCGVTLPPEGETTTNDNTPIGQPFGTTAVSTDEDTTAAEPDTTAEVTTAEETTATTAADTTDPYEGLSSAERQVREIADTALRERYSLPAWEHFAIRVDDAADGSIWVWYDLELFGYYTSEGYRVILDAHMAVTQVSGYSVGKYACYLETATAEAFAAAEEKLGGDRSELYLTVDSEGWLCLCKEEIVSIFVTPETDESGNVLEDAPTSGCGIDHEHVFYTERICSAE